MAGVHGLQHVQGFARANLSDDDPVWAHAQGIPDKLPHGDLTAPLQVGGTSLQRHDVLLVKLELGRILDGHNPFVGWDEGAENVQGRRLAAAGAPGDKDVQSRPYASCQEQGHAPVQGAVADEVFDLEGLLGELPDRQRRTPERQGGDDCIHARAVRKPSVDHRTGFVNPPPEGRNDPLDQVHHFHVGREPDRRKLQAALPLNIDLVTPVDHDFSNGFIIEQGLNGPKTNDLREQRLSDFLSLKRTDLLFLGQKVQDPRSDRGLLGIRKGTRPGHRRGIEFADELVLNPLLQLAVHVREPFWPQVIAFQANRPGPGAPAGFRSLPFQPPV